MIRLGVGDAERAIGAEAAPPAGAAATDAVVPDGAEAKAGREDGAVWKEDGELPRCIAVSPEIGGWALVGDGMERLVYES